MTINFDSYSKLATDNIFLQFEQFSLAPGTIFIDKADDESSNKKHFDLYFILISQKLSIF